MRIGIAGLGAIATRFHLPILQASPLCEVVGLAEAEASRRTALAAQLPQARVFPSWQQLLAETQLDALVVCLPPQLHAACGLAAINNGLAVYMEKPLAPTLDEARQLAQASQTAKAPLMMGFNFRFHPAIAEMRAQLQAGRLGPLLTVRSTFTTPAPHAENWRRSPNAGGSASLDLGVHHVDLFRFLTGHEVREASVLEHDSGSRSVVQLCSDHGVLFDGLFARGAPEHFQIDLIGEKGQLSFARHLDHAPVFRAVDQIWTRAEKVRRGLLALQPRNLRYGPGHEPSFSHSLAAFIHAVQSKKTIQPDWLDGLRAQEVFSKVSA